MHSKIFASILILCGAQVSCSSEQSHASSRVLDGTSSDIQVNPMAFNAYQIWFEGQGTEILDYPQGWFQGQDGRTLPDGFFHEDPARFPKTVT